MFFNLFVAFRHSLGVRRKPDRQQALQLRAMSDLELRDLGVGRSEIPAVLEPGERARAERPWGNRR